MPVEKIVLTSEGLHLSDSILWFDARTKDGLSFLSSANVALDFSIAHVIATQETIKIIGLKRPSSQALICQYNQPFVIGKLSIELLPSGSILGGASLYLLNASKERFLYAPCIQINRNSTVRKYQTRKSDILILKANHPDPHSVMPNRKREIESLVDAIKESMINGLPPTVICQTMPTAQELTRVFSDSNLPVMVHSSIFKINRIYESFGSDLGHYGQYRPNKLLQKITLMPLQNSPYRTSPIPKGPVFFVEDNCSATYPNDFFAKVSKRFYIGSSGDGRDLVEFIHETAPSEVYLFGPYTKSYIQFLKSTCGSVQFKALFSNHQPPLF